MARPVLLVRRGRRDGAMTTVALLGLPWDEHLVTDPRLTDAGDLGIPPGPAHACALGRVLDPAFALGVSHPEPGGP